MRHVSIEDQGRCGTVTYHEAGHRLACYWEFGGADATAFVGTRPPVPDKVSEPLLVIIEHHSGRPVTHSLWQ